MVERRRVTFRFGGDTEVQYIHDLPEVGDYVTRRNEIWMVSRVEMDGIGVLIICDRPPKGPRSGGSVEAAMQS